MTAPNVRVANGRLYVDWKKFGPVRLSGADAVDLADRLVDAAERIEAREHRPGRGPAKPSLKAGAISTERQHHE